MVLLQSRALFYPPQSSLPDKPCSSFSGWERDLSLRIRYIQQRRPEACRFGTLDTEWEEGAGHRPWRWGYKALVLVLYLNWCPGVIMPCSSCPSSATGSATGSKKILENTTSYLLFTFTATPHLPVLLVWGQASSRLTRS